MATHPNYQRLKVNQYSQVLKIMTSPYIATIDQYHTSYQPQPTMLSNMKNNNP